MCHADLTGHSYAHGPALAPGLALPGTARLWSQRFLSEAETHPTNLPMMERLDSLADTWLGVAALLTERERV